MGFPITFSFFMPIGKEVKFFFVKEDAILLALPIMEFCSCKKMGLNRTLLAINPKTEMYPPIRSDLAGLNLINS